jgi:hypothetical protein
MDLPAGVRAEMEAVLQGAPHQKVSTGTPADYAFSWAAVVCRLIHYRGFLSCRYRYTGYSTAQCVSFTMCLCISPDLDWNLCHVVRNVLVGQHC